VSSTATPTPDLAVAGYFSSDSGVSVLLGGVGGIGE
jgi:hypothetical protein